MKLTEIRGIALKHGKICDHCLGRQISLLFKGKPVEDIGAALRAAKKDADVELFLQKKNLGKRTDKKLKPLIMEDCEMCGDLFAEKKIKQMLEKVTEKLNDQEFHSFLIGCKLPNKMQEYEEELWAKIGMENCEPVKREINRLFGAKVVELTGKKVNFNNPDVIFTLNYKTNRVETSINSLFIFGEYKKLIRGIPQTKWPCSKCKGIGCAACDNTGKQYKETVEELIAAVPVKLAKARNESFHGEGREDIDALMIGTGRPFVLELKEPIIRNLDLEKLAGEINASAGGKVSVGNLRFSSKEEVRLIKKISHDKTYEVIIECDGYTGGDLEKIQGLSGRTLMQETPNRVMHRRADKTRKRKVINIKCEKINKTSFKAVITAESGTYIKELISGDEGRTKPSFSAEIGKPCKCIQLDVTEIRRK